MSVRSDGGSAETMRHTLGATGSSLVWRRLRRPAPVAGWTLAVVVLVLGGALLWRLLFGDPDGGAVSTGRPFVPPEVSAEAGAEAGAAADSDCWICERLDSVAGTARFRGESSVDAAAPAETAGPPETATAGPGSIAPMTAAAVVAPRPPSPAASPSGTTGGRGQGRADDDSSGHGSGSSGPGSGSSGPGSGSSGSDGSGGDGESGD